jgi:hypothetical protein
MNVYQRILNILLEARVDMFIQDRLDEARLERGNSPPVRAYIRDMRAKAGHNPNVGSGEPEEKGIDLMDKRLKAHIASRGQKKPKP